MRPRFKDEKSRRTAAVFHFASNQNCSPSHFGQVRFRMLKATRQSRHSANSSSRILLLCPSLERPRGEPRRPISSLALVLTISPPFDLGRFRINCLCNLGASRGSGWPSSASSGALQPKTFMEDGTFLIGFAASEAGAREERSRKPDSATPWGGSNPCIATKLPAAGLGNA